MKISTEKNIVIGLKINLAVVIASALIFASRTNQLRIMNMDSILDWVGFALFFLSVLFWVTLYFIIKSNWSTKRINQDTTTNTTQLLQSILDNTSNPVFIKKVNGEYLLINKKSESLFNLPTDKIIGKTDHEIHHGDLADIFRNTDLEVLKTHKEVRSEHQAQQPDGIHTYIVVKFPLYDPDKRIYAIGGICTDITERIKLEEALKASDQFFNNAFDILTIIKNDRFIKINPAFTKLLGYDQNDLDDIKFTALTHPDDKTTTDEVLARNKKGEITVNYKNRIRSKDGTFKWIDWHGTFDLSQEVLYSVGRDVTDKVRLETEQQITTKLLYENEERLRLIIDNISEGVIVVNSRKQIVMANEMANEILDIKENADASYNLTERFEIYLPDEKTIFPSQKLPMELALSGEETNDIDLILWNENQKKRVLISGKPLIDDDNRIVAAVVTIKDISKYKQMEEKLKETEIKYRRLIGFKSGE